MSVKIFIISLKNNKYINETIKDVIKLIWIELFKARIKDFLFLLPRAYPTIPSTVKAYESKKKAAINYCS